jgi:hypothetical protein
VTARFVLLFLSLFALNAVESGADSSLKMMKPRHYLAAKMYPEDYLNNKALTNIGQAAEKN